MSYMPTPLTSAQIEHVLTIAQLPGIITDARIQTPALIVLLGSTPALAAVELCKQMLSLSPRDRRRVALVYIDTDSQPDELITFRKAHEGTFQEFDLRIAVPAGIDFATLPSRPTHTYIPGKTPQYFSNGAGGIRNNGHVAAAFDYHKIVQTIESALVAIEKIEPLPGEERVREVQANVVAFLGGGTGSGILGDVAVIVRQLLATRLYQQRLNLFCMLPEPIEGASANDVSWRKSNATACLLELLAASLAAAAQAAPANGRTGYDPRDGHRNVNAVGRAYRKYLLSESHEVSDDPIANEVYLIGRTATGSANDTARIVGIDLFQRLMDRSGVGFLEHSTWVNRRSLGATDDRLLPTMFGTSCPLEVMFPAQQTARAFAQVAASYLLPALIGQKPSDVEPSETQKVDWRKSWREVARLTPSVRPNSLDVKLPDDFSELEFDNASEATFSNLKAELEQRQSHTDQQIKDKIEEKRRLELEALVTLPSTREGMTEGLKIVQRQRRHLQLKRDEYGAMLTMQAKSPPEEEPEYPQQEQDEYLRQPWIRFPLVQDRTLKRKSADLCAAYNDKLRFHVEATRYHALVGLLTDLRQEAVKRLAEADSWYSSENDASKQSQRLRAEGQSSAAWRGELESPHAHIRHVFDLDELREATVGAQAASRRGRNLAVERLFNWATTPPDLQRPLAHADAHFIEEAIAYRFIAPCMAYLAHHTARSAGEQAGEGAGQGGPQAGAPNAMRENADSLETQGKSRLADQVVAFFEDYYLHGIESTRDNTMVPVPGFTHMTLFDLLGVGSQNDPRADVTSYLLQHLQNIRRLMEGLIAFEETLWEGGATRLDTTVYLSMRWEKDGVGERMIKTACKQLGPLTQRNQTPTIANMRDPHRLQVSYGQHGISLASVPDFYRDRNSAMAAYLRHQGEWFGYRGPEPILKMPAPPSYAANKMPAHASGEIGAACL